MKKYDVITMGSGLVDAFLEPEGRESRNKICFNIGDKIKVNKIEFSMGGGGTNTATCLSNLGLKTGFLGKIGSGNNGGIILRELRKRKIDFLGIQTKNSHTGYSIVFISKKRNRTIFTYKGASNGFLFREINFNKINTNWIHFTSMGNESFKTQKRIIDYTNKKGIKISFNPSSYQTRKGKKHLSKFLKCSYLISMNRGEATMLVKKNLCKNLHDLGPEIVIVTNGNKPGEVYDGKFYYKYYPNKIKVRNVTGAGDVFTSSFIGGLIRTKDIDKSIKIAMVNVESFISKKSIKEGLLTFNEALKKIKNKNYKVLKKEI